MNTSARRGWKQVTKDGARFYSVGAAGVAVQLTFLTLLAGYFKLNYLIATTLAVELAVLHNFVWHERWTWKHRSLNRKLRLNRLASFNLTSGAFSIVGNVALMRVFVGMVHLHLFLSNLLSIGSCSLLNFLISHRFIFRSKERAGADVKSAPEDEGKDACAP